MASQAETQLASDSKPHPGRKLTWEEFHDWLDEDTRAEWDDGEVYLMASHVAYEHQEILHWLVAVLKAFSGPRSLGLVFFAPFQMKLTSAPLGREPDVMFLRAGRESQFHETYVEGPGDLAVEILSPESLARDRGRKFVEYEAEGILEYWLVDPTRRNAEFYRLDAGRYQPVPPVDGWIRSAAVPGFAIKPEWFWRDGRPNVADTMREIGRLVQEA